MSIPKSRVLSVSKGFGASAEIYHTSPNQTQVVNVNVADKQDPEVIVEPNTIQSEPVREVQPLTIDVKPSEVNSNDGSVDSLLKYKDNVIEALSVLLLIIENNPLIINKFIVASAEDLAQLIKLLTGADSVQINTSNDIDCQCITSGSYRTVDKIYVVKGNETSNFKYSYPDANKILDDHHVSVKLVRV